MKTGHTPLVLSVAAILGACATVAFTPMKAGLLEFGGSQKTIFEKGKAEAVVPLAVMSGQDDVQGVGAVSGLDGEITVFKGKPFVTQVRGDAYAAMGAGAAFAAALPFNISPAR